MCQKNHYALTLASCIASLKDLGRTECKEQWKQEHFRQKGGEERSLTEADPGEGGQMLLP